MYLVHEGKSHWIASVPAVFMTAVCSTYILMAPEGLGLSSGISYPIGIAAAVGAMAWFFSAARKQTSGTSQAH